MAARTVTAKVQVNANRTLTVQLPDDIQTGEYEIVLVLNNTVSSDTQTPEPDQRNDQRAAVTTAWETWVQEVEQLPLEPNPASADYPRHLIEKYRKQGLEL